MNNLSLANRMPARASFQSFLPQPALPAPLPKGRSSASNLEQALDMLHDAERVIQSQEERIRQLETLSITDELTGLMNRRGLMAALRRELSLTRRTEKTAGLLILIDLDDFKQVNDLYGHDVGDTYLQTVGSVLINEVRTSDFVARLGGDEFAVLLPQIALRVAGARLEALEKILNSRIMHSRAHAIPLCASFGFSVIAEGETPESLLISADKKLYASKARRKMGMKG